MKNLTIQEEKKLNVRTHPNPTHLPDHIIKTKTLIQTLGKARTIDVLYSLSESPKSWSDLLKSFGMRKGQSGFLGHFIRHCQNDNMIAKDEKLNVYYLTFRGRKCVEFLDLLRPLATLSIDNPELSPTPEQLNLDMSKSWLEPMLRQALKNILQKTTSEIS